MPRARLQLFDRQALPHGSSADNRPTLSPCRSSTRTKGAIPRPARWPSCSSIPSSCPWCCSGLTGRDSWLSCVESAGSLNISQEGGCTSIYGSDHVRLAGAMPITVLTSAAGEKDPDAKVSARQSWRLLADDQSFGFSSTSSLAIRTYASWSRT